MLCPCVISCRPTRPSVVGSPQAMTRRLLLPPVKCLGDRTVHILAYCLVNLTEFSVCTLLGLFDICGVRIRVRAMALMAGM